MKSPVTILAATKSNKPNSMYFAASRRISILLICATVVSVALISGCTSYQLVSVKGNLAQSKNQELVFENDSLKVTYSFNGMACPVKIRIFNKLQQPIFVDWSKSAAVVNDLKISYWEDVASFSGVTDGSSVKISKYLELNSSDVNGTVKRKEKISFIPPQSGILNNPTYLRATFFEINQSIVREKVVYQTTAGPATFLKINFKENETPLSFRSFLTLSVKDDFSEPIYLAHNFWVSDIIKSNVNPESLLNKPLNQFYLQKATGFGTLMGCTFITGLLVALALLSD